MCAASIEWIRRHDRRQLFQSIPFQDCPTPPMTPEIFEGATSAVYVVSKEGQTYRGADAAFFILARTGWGWFARFLALPPFIWFARMAYSVVAKNRGWISQRFFGGEACRLDQRPPRT